MLLHAGKYTTEDKLKTAFSKIIQLMYIWGHHCHVMCCCGWRKLLLLCCQILPRQWRVLPSQNFPASWSHLCLMLWGLAAVKLACCSHDCCRSLLCFQTPLMSLFTVYVPLVYDTLAAKHLW